MSNPQPSQESSTPLSDGCRCEIMPQDRAGYPCLAEAYYEPKNMKAGDQGVIKAISPDGRWTQVAFTVSNKPVAIVPSNHVKVGVLRKFGRYVILTANPESITSNGQMPVLNTSSILETSTTGSEAGEGLNHRSVVLLTNKGRAL